MQQCLADAAALSDCSLCNSMGWFNLQQLAVADAMLCGVWWRCCCRCAGVFMTLTAVNVKPAACKLIYGDKTAGVFRRAMTRMRADAEHTDMYAIVGFQ